MICMLLIIKINWKKMEQQFQYVTQKILYDNNLNYFTDNFAQHFTQKPSQQQCHKIIPVEIISTINPIGLMKNWGK